MMFLIFEILLLCWKGSAAAIAFGFTSDEAFCDQNKLSPVLSIPYNRDVMPLPVVYCRVFSERQIDVL